MKYDNKQRFSIRKYSVGVASVLLGVAAIAGGGVAQADEMSDTSATAPVSDTETSAAITTTADLVTTSAASQVSSSTTASVASAIPAQDVATVAQAASASEVNSVVSSQSQVADTVSVSDRSAVDTTSRAAAASQSLTAPVQTASASDATDPMPTGDLTDLSQMARPDESDLITSDTNLSGNQATAASLPSEYLSFNTNDDNKRVAMIVAVSARDGQTDDRYYSLVAALDSATYEVREYNRNKRLMNTVVLGSNDQHVFYPAGGRTADRPKLTVVANDQGARLIFDRARNWKTTNKYDIKTVYSTLVSPVIPSSYGGASNSQSNFDQFTQELPFASEVKVNYIIRGTGEQIADSNIITAFANDSYKTVAADESDFYQEYKDKGYTLVETPTYKDGKINATYWGGKGFVAINDVTNTVAGITRDLRVRRTVINDQGDIVIEAWDKASGVKLPIQRYTKTNGEVVNLSGFNTYVSEAIRPSDTSLSSNALYKEVAFAFADDKGVMFYSNDSQTRYTATDIAKNSKLAGGTRLSSWTSSWRPAAAEINYVYAKTKANVTATYINTDGSQIKDSQLVAALATIGSSYNADTPNLKPSRIITADNKVYVLVSKVGVTSTGLSYGANGVVTGNGYAPISGNVTEDDQVIVFVYQLDEQKAVVTYVNDSRQEAVLAQDDLSGLAGEVMNYSTADRIKAFEALGYELISDGFTSASDKRFDADSTTTQTFVVHLKERIVPVKADDPKPVPGQPVTPEDPAKWPKGSDKIGDLRRQSTQTVNYRTVVDGKEVFKPVHRKVTWERIAYVNLVTGEIDLPDNSWTIVKVENADLDTTPIVNETASATRSAAASSSRTTALRSVGSLANAPRLVASASTPTTAVAQASTTSAKQVSKPVLKRQVATRRSLRR